MIHITGPAIINNIVFASNAVGVHAQSNCFGLDQTVWTNCNFSTEDMNVWDYGSCKITCTAL